MENATNLMSPSTGVIGILPSKHNIPEGPEYDKISILY